MSRINGNGWEFIQGFHNLISEKDLTTKATFAFSNRNPVTIPDIGSPAHKRRHHTWKKEHLGKYAPEKDLDRSANQRNVMRNVSINLSCLEPIKNRTRSAKSLTRLRSAVRSELMVFAFLYKLHYFSRGVSFFSGGWVALGETYFRVKAIFFSFMKTRGAGDST